MLQTTPRPFPILTHTGQIDMALAFRVAHKMARDDFANQTAVLAIHARKGTTPHKPARTYREFFAARLRDHFASARKAKAMFATGHHIISTERSYFGSRWTETTLARF